MKLTSPQRRLIKESRLDDVSLLYAIPLDKHSMLENGELPDPKTIAKNLFEVHPPEGITSAAIEVLNAKWFEDKRAEKVAKQHFQHLLRSGTNWKGEPVMGLGFNGLLVTTIRTNLSAIMTQEIQYGLNIVDILNKLKVLGVDKLVFNAAKEWLIDNFESIDVVRIGKQSIDKYPTPRLSDKELNQAREVQPPELEFPWNN